MKFVKMLEERDIRDVDMLNEQGAVSVNTIRKLPTYHVIIFARNETGRINLYKLVSQLSQTSTCSQKCTGAVQRRTSGGKCL